MRPIYTAKHLKYLKSIYKGRHILETTKLFNKRFRMRVTPAALKTYAQRFGLRSGYKPGSDWNKKYYEKHIRFLKKNVPGRHYSETVKIFNKRFGFTITARQLASLCKRVGIQTGFTGYFPKGHVPHNKGIKGVYYPGCEKGWFKKGDVPWDYMPVGTERVNADGYVDIKITDTAMPVQRRWKAKHIILWEKEHGKVPRGHCVIFLDGNKKNITLNNLMMVSRQVHAVMCHLNYFTKDRERTRANCTLAQLKVAIGDRKRESFKRVKRTMVFLDNNGMRIQVVKIEGKKKWVAMRESKYGLRLLKAKIKPRNSIAAARRDLYEYALTRNWQRVEK